MKKSAYTVGRIFVAQNFFNYLDNPTDLIFFGMGCNPYKGVARKKFNEGVSDAVNERCARRNREMNGGSY